MMPYEPEEWEEKPVEGEPVAEEKPIEEAKPIDPLEATVAIEKRAAIRTMLKANGVKPLVADSLELVTERQTRASILAICKVTEAEYRAAGGKL